MRTVEKLLICWLFHRNMNLHQENIQKTLLHLLIKTKVDLPTPKFCRNQFDNFAKTVFIIKNIIMVQKYQT